MNTSDNTPWPENSTPGEDMQVLKKLASIKEPWNKKTKEEASDYIVALVDKVLFYEKNNDAINAVREGQEILSLEDYIADKKKKAKAARDEIIAIMESEVSQIEESLEARQEEIKIIRGQIETERDDAEVALHQELDAKRVEYLGQLELDRSRLESEVNTARQELTKHIAEISTLEEKIDAKQESYNEVKSDLHMTYVAYHAYFNPSGTLDKLALKLREAKRNLKEVLLEGDLFDRVSSTSYAGEELEEYKALVLGSYNQEIENIRLSPNYRDIETVKGRLQEAYIRANKLASVFGVAITDEYRSLQEKVVDADFIYARKLENDVLEQKENDEKLREQAAVGKQAEAALEKILQEKEILERQMKVLSDENRLRVEQGEELDVSDESPMNKLQGRLDALMDKWTQTNASVQNLKSGYVYIVSNPATLTGFKIALTRAPEPQRVIDNLDNNAVPFAYVTHALFYSENAVGIRDALHERFADKRINKVKYGKQFFDVTKSEIKEALKDIVGNVDFIDEPIQQDVVDSNNSPVAP